MEKISYEEAMKELESLVDKLDKTTPTLEESVKIYERAGELATFCQNELSKATKKIFEIRKVLDKIVEEEIE